MGTKAYLREFLKYSSLNVLGMIALSCYILADTFFVSKALGADGLAALNLAIPVYSFIHGSGLMIGMGGGIKYSIVKSQGAAQRADQIFTNAAVLTAAIAACFFLTGLLASGPLALLLGADGTVYEMTRIYIQVILLFAPMFMANNLLLCFMRNDGAPQLSMAAMITGSLSNVVLDYVFMFPFGMGIFGAVFATGLAPVISILVLSTYLFRRKNQFRLRKCRVSGRLTLGICSSGLPSLITELSSGIVIIVFNMIILGIAGNIGVAAYGVIANIALVAVSIFTGISQGLQPLASVSAAENDRKTLARGLRLSLLLALFVSALLLLTAILFGEPITALFNKQGDAKLAALAERGLVLYFTGFFAAGINIVCAAFAAACARVRESFAISILRGAVLIVPAVLFLPEIAGTDGIWLSFPAAEALTLLVSVLFLVSFFRKFAKSAKSS